MSIYSASNSILRNAILKDNNSFSYAVQESGAHQICLQAAEMQSYQLQARRVFLQLETGPLVSYTDDKLTQAKRVDQLPSGRSSSKHSYVPCVRLNHMPSTSARFNIEVSRRCSLGWSTAGRP